MTEPLGTCDGHDNGIPFTPHARRLECINWRPLPQPTPPEPPGVKVCGILVLPDQHEGFCDYGDVEAANERAWNL